MTFLSNIAYLRSHAPQGKRWKSIGKLFYDEVTHRGKVLLYGFRYGMAIAKPDTVTNPPFLQGDITIPIGVDGPLPQDLWVGFVTTSDEERGVAYSFSFETMPIVTSMTPSGLWFNIDLEDGPDPLRKTL